MTAAQRDGGREAKALAAVIRYDAAAAATSAATKAIGEAIARCPVSAEYEASGWDDRRYMDGKHLRTHLHEVMTETTPCDSGYGDRRKHDDEVEADLDELGCAPCQEAWRLIQQRRQARKEFGIAKRAIRSIGRAARTERPE